MSLEESLLQSFFARILSATKLQAIHWPICPCKNVLREVFPSTWNFWPKLTNTLQKRRFPIDIRS